MYTNWLDDALTCLVPGNARSKDYARGLFVGLVVGMSYGSDITGALRLIARHWRPQYSFDYVPDLWAVEIQEYIESYAESARPLQELEDEE